MRRIPNNAQGIEMKMNSLTHWLTKRSNGNRLAEIVWNAAGSGMMAVQAAVLLIFIAAKYSLTVAGIVTIAYAIANLLMTFANYGVRTFQVTDQKEQFLFSDYLYARFITVAVSLAAALFFVLIKISSGTYDTTKAMIVLEITALKLVDSVGDVFHGRYQQLDRFISAARIQTIQQFSATGLICLLIACDCPIEAAFAAGIALSALLLAFLIRSSFRAVDDSAVSPFCVASVLSLLKKCLPLCIGTSLAKNRRSSAI